MSYAVTDTIQQFTFAGTMSARVLLFVGIGWLIVSALLLWWELGRSRLWIASLLWLLRSGAIAVVLWLLAGPSLLTHVRHSQPKSIVVIADRSGSMNVADSADEIEADPMELRWLLRQSQLDAAVTKQLDAAAASLRLAASLARHGPTHKSGGRHSRAVSVPSNIIDDAKANLDRASSLLSPTQSAVDRTVASQVRRLRDQATQIVGDLNSALRDESKEPRAAAPLKALDDLSDAISKLADTSAVAALQSLRPQDRDRLRAQAEQSRSTLAAGWLQEAQSSWLGAAGKQAKVLSYAFDTTVELVAKEWKVGPATAGNRTGTDLAAALSQLAQDSASSPLAAAIVLTDGGHNANTDPVKAAASLQGMPVFIVPIGQSHAVRDVLIHHVQAPRAVFKNDTIPIEGLVDAQGCDGEEISLELVRNDVTIETQRIPVTGDAFSRSFTFRRKADQVGIEHYTIRTIPLPKERLLDNNQEKLTVEVTEDKIRLLLADHLPRWEHRYLRNLFSRDPRVEMDELLFEPLHADGSPASGRGWPADLEEWNRYRVVILGDITPAELDAAQQKLLDRFVRERGGTLILIAGEEAMPASFATTPFERLLPVQLSELPASSDAGFTLYVTTEGRDAPALQLSDDAADSERLWREQIGLHRLSTYAKPKPTAHVWLGASPLEAPPNTGRPDQVFLCWQDDGAGRVIYFSAAMTYRLRFRQGDTYHHRFWGQLLRWAIAREVSAGSQTVRLTTDKMRYPADESTLVTVRLRRMEGDAVGGAKISVAAEQDRRAIARIDLREDGSVPGQYLGALRKLPAGSVHLRPEGQDVDVLLKSEGRSEPVETVIVIDPPDDQEHRNTRCNLPLLHQIAHATGGQVVPPDAVSSVMAQVDLSPEVSEEVSQQPLWTRWGYLWLFVGCLTAEWVIRKVAGMA